MNMPAPKPVRKFEHDCEIVVTRFSPCGKFLFGLTYQGSVIRWSLADEAKTVLTGHNGWMQGIAFHPDGTQMVTGDSWGQLCCWNYADAAPKPKWTTKDAHRMWMRGLALTPDGSLVATCASDRRVRLWSMADGSLKQDVAAHGDDLFSIQFTPDGKSLLWGDMKGTVTQWDLAAGTVARKIDVPVMYLRPEGMSGIPEINDVGGIRSLQFDSTGKVLACIGCQPLSSGFVQAKPLVVLIDWESGKEIERLMLPDANGNDGIAYDALFHPAGYVIAASSGQTGGRGIWYWKPGEKKPLHVESALPHCRSVSLHPDGKQLAVAQTLLQKGALTGNVKAEKKGDYPGTMACVHLYELATA